ncbi:MAG TPA: TetR/AcrR family transcriptional regulator [Solirubrobacteraceae bacterium]|jgi:AcrR family transcriptional regulator
MRIANHSDTKTGPASRQDRRRAQTRAKLLGAAGALFARQGVENTRINEITEEADLGFGSFYNHFENKEAIVAAVVEQAAAAAAEAIDAATRSLKDPAEVVAVAHRSLIKQAVDDPEWGWLLVRLEISHNLASRTLGPYARRDLARGIESGRFRVDDPEVALIAAGGALLAVIRTVLQTPADETTAQHHAACVLRIFGLSPHDAAEVAARPLRRRRPSG